MPSIQELMEGATGADARLMRGFAERAGGFRPSAVRDVFEVAMRPGIVSLAGGNPDLELLGALVVQNLVGEGQVIGIGSALAVIETEAAEAEAPAAAQPAVEIGGARLEEILGAINDLKRITQASAGETIEMCRRELGEAFAMRGELDKMKEAITAGEIYQVVPSRGFVLPCPDALAAYHQLRETNPSPYMFYVDCGDAQLVGASPETLCQIVQGKVAVHAIAGTVRRGATPQEDAALGEALLQSPKDRAEHIMLVDLARNDVNRVCDPTTTRVESLMNVEKFSHVIHLTSRITGQLRPDRTKLDALRSIFPAGTVSGAPKIRAIELVSQLEQERRGVYAGAVGRIDYAKHDLDVCIAIRTMTFKDNTAYLQAGGGIVHDSVEEDEYIETMNKLAGNLRCLMQAEASYASPT